MSRSMMVQAPRARARMSKASPAQSATSRTTPAQAAASWARLEAPTPRQRPVTRHPSYLTLVSIPGAPQPPRPAGADRRRARPRRAATRQATRRSADRATLTRRGRGLLVVLIAVGVALGASIALALIAGVVGPSAGASPGGTSMTAPLTVVVEPGDTLWGIARQFRPEAPTWDTVREIREANSLTDSAIRPGQRLVLPVNGGQ